MKKRSRIIIAISIIVALTAVLLAVIRDGKLKQSQSGAGMSLEERAADAYRYATHHGLNTNYALFLDYSIPSGMPRLFVWDYKKNMIVARTYVMHGVGGGSTMSKPVFSNKVGSKCSSIGRFEVTKKHGNKLKRSYRLKGLDRSCSNAYRRGLMIHRSTWVDVWCWKKYIPLHEESCKGCVTVSSKGMSYLERLIQSQSEPILLWSYI